MKPISREIDSKGNIIITCEDFILFGLIKRNAQYIATNEYPKGYWNWRLLPNKTIVNSFLSFQLDEWCRDFD